MNQKITKNYFEIDDENIIYPSTSSKRFAAKIVDILIVNLIIFILSIIVMPIILGSEGYLKLLNQENHTFTLLINRWDWRIMLFDFSKILIWIIFLLIIPIFNFRNKGQSLGKKLFSLTPIFLEKKYKNIKIFIRELPILLFFILQNLFIIIIGYDLSNIIVEYSNEISKMSLPTENSVSTIISNIGLSSFFSTSFIVFSWILFLSFIIFIVLFFYSVKDRQKRGVHDKLVNIAIVDLKTIIPISNLNAYQQNKTEYDYENNNPQNIVEIDPILSNGEEVKVEIIDKEDNLKDDLNSLEQKSVNNENEKLDENLDDTNDEKEIIKEENSKKVENNIDYNKLKVSELKDLLTKDNIKFKSNMKKNELIELLKNKKD